MRTSILSSRTHNLYWKPDPVVVDVKEDRGETIQSDEYIENILRCEEHEGDAKIKRLA